MQLIKRHLPLITFIATFCLAAGGRFAALSPDIHGRTGWVLLFGFYTASIFSYLPALVTASGFLQRKLFNMIFLLIVGILLAVFKRYVSVPLIGIGFYSFLSIIALWFLDRRDSRKPDFVLAESEKLPKKHRKPRLLMKLFTLFFRLLPCPAPVGLYKIGRPDEFSDILVTGNYSLTLNRVVRSLKRQNCWLLVCDSRGINIWCATLAGHFGTDQIIRALSLTDLAERSRSKTLTLPQLCAAGVSLERLESKTGFTAQFGPIRIRDYQSFREDPDNSGYRLVRFPLVKRVEMAFGTMLIPSVLLFFIFNFIDLSRLAVILPAALIVSILNAVTFPHRFIKNVYIWSIVFAGIIFGISCTLLPLMYSITLGLVSLYLVNEFEGWSPLVKFDMFASYKKSAIAVEREKCTGCGRCIRVCPKGVFDINDNYSSPVRFTDCVSCKACLFQCPERAVVAKRNKM